MSKPAFVLGTGRSGTLWVAQALKESGHLDARHETTQSCRDAPMTTFGQVEVNSFLWDCVPRIQDAWGRDVMLIHLVRDGRAVVRSMMSRLRNGRTFEGCCEEWVQRNHYLWEHVPRSRMFRLEQLTRNWSEWRRLCKLLGSNHPSFEVWDALRERRANATNRHLTVPFRKWPRPFHIKFQEICGDEMLRLGYLAKY